MIPWPQTEGSVHTALARFVAVLIEWLRPRSQ
jgi:hypothetical protein